MHLENTFKKVVLIDGFMVGEIPQGLLDGLREDEISVLQMYLFLFMTASSLDEIYLCFTESFTESVEWVTHSLTEENLTVDDLIHELVDNYTKFHQSVYRCLSFLRELPDGVSVCLIEVKVYGGSYLLDITLQRDGDEGMLVNYSPPIDEIMGVPYGHKGQTGSNIYQSSI